MFETIVDADEISNIWYEKFRVVECCGCNHISFNYEVADDDCFYYGEEGDSIDVIPKSVSYPIQEQSIKPISLWDIPENVYCIYLETIKAFNSECYILAGAGARATIEAICKERNIIGRTLENKINKLKTEGVVTTADRDRLHAIRFMGNDSIHEMKLPDKSSLVLAIEIIHNILSNLYVLDKKVRRMMEKPVSTFKEFAKLLESGLRDKQVGDLVTLRAILPHDRRLIKDDIVKFETELKQKINAGEYTLLSICTVTHSTGPQQYRVENGV